MLNQNSFNSIKWISENTRDSTELSAKALEAVANFTIMWNLFENTVCKNNASNKAFKTACDKLALDSFSPATIGAIEKCLSVCRSRYCTGDDVNSRFNNLRIRRNDCKELVKSVLIGNSENPQEKLHALMIIVYRLRNNLFHGLKSVNSLNDQTQSLDNASQFLATILEVTSSDYLLVIPTQHSPVGKSFD